MNKFDKRFDTEIEKRKFNFFEIVGFQKEPKLAIKAGMAIGYQMALDDFKDQLDDLTTIEGPPEVTK